METSRQFLLYVVMAIVVLCFAVPYLLLSGIDAWYGSFLFWVVCAAVVIGINAVVSSAWKD